MPLYRKLNLCQKFLRSLEFQHQYIPYLLLTLVATLVVALLKFSTIIDDDSWANFWDPLITVATLLSTILLAIYTVYKSWEMSREKRITTVFIYNHEENIRTGTNDKIEEIKDSIASKLKELAILSDRAIQFELEQEILQLKQNLKVEHEKVSNSRILEEFLTANNIQSGKNYVIMVCFEALLSGENDMRQWAQQIGGQMSESIRLSFFPYFEISPSEIIEINLNRNITQIDEEKNENQTYRVVNHHIIVYHIREIPINIVKKGKAIIWDDNYENTAKNIVREIPVQAIEKSDYQSYESLVNWYKSQFGK